MEDNRRRQPSDTPKSGRSKKRMRGSGSTSEPPMMAVEGEEEIMRDFFGFTGKCSECSKEFSSERALSGHMRCHPERNWRGINPPPMAARMVNTNVGVTAEEEIADSLVLLSTVEVCTKKKEDKEDNQDVGADAVTPPPPPPPPATAEVEEEAVAGGGFECSGCKRVFDSHQALGGHRASHKNIQGCYASEKKDNEVLKAPVTELSRRDAVVITGTQDHQERRPMLPPPPPPPTERYSTRREGGGDGSVVITGKEYKCCVCSKTFSTGQALGGHMRWHLERNQLLGLAVAAAASGSVSAATTFSSLSSSSSHLQHHMRLTNLGRGTGDHNPLPPPPPPFRSNHPIGCWSQLGSISASVRGPHQMMRWNQGASFRFGSPSSDHHHPHQINRVYGLGQQVRRASGLGEHQLYGTPGGSSSSNNNPQPSWLQQGWISGSSSTLIRPGGGHDHGVQFPHSSSATNPRWINLQRGDDINHGLNLNLSLNLTSTPGGHENPRNTTTTTTTTTTTNDDGGNNNPNNNDNDVTVSDNDGAIDNGNDTELRLGIGTTTTTTTLAGQEEHGSSPPSSSSPEIDLDLKLG